MRLCTPMREGGVGAASPGSLGGAADGTDPLAAERARYGDQLDAAVQSVAAQLQAMPAVRKVVLFGSYAAGRRDLLTDLDLLVVMDSDEEFVTRNATLAGRIRCGVALDLLAYTPAEMALMQERPFIRQALDNGKVLYAAAGA